MLSYVYAMIYHDIFKILRLIEFRFVKFGIDCV